MFKPIVATAGQEVQMTHQTKSNNGDLHLIASGVEYDPTLNHVASVT